MAPWPRLQRGMCSTRQAALLCGALVLSLSQAGCVRAGFAGDGSCGEACAGGPGDAPQAPGDGTLHDAVSARDSGCVWGPFSAPVLVPEVSALSTDDWGPSNSADGLELYFASWRVGGLGECDIWVAQRASVLEPFQPPTSLTAVSSAGADNAPCISADGDTLVFASQGRPGNLGGYDLYQASRASEAGFSVPVMLATVNSAYTDTGPSLAQDGLTLYFDSHRPGGKGGADIYRASRASIADDFSSVVNLSALNSAGSERAACISPDGLELFFSTDRPGGKGKHDIWVATRPSKSDAFSAPVNVAELSSTGDDTGPDLSSDGTTMYLNYNTEMSGRGSQPSNIWVATRSCVSQP